MLGVSVCRSGQRSRHRRNQPLFYEIRRTGISPAGRISQLSGHRRSGHYRRILLLLQSPLVRGQGYYTGPVFEISCGQYASSVGGGGRYDKMVGREVGEDVPAVGFSIGFERICDVLSEHPEIFNPSAKLKKIALVYNETDDFVSVMQKAEDLRTEGFWVNIQKRSKKLGKQLDTLVDAGYGFCWLFGESTEPKPLAKK